MLIYEDLLTKGLQEIHLDLQAAMRQIIVGILDLVLEHPNNLQHQAVFFLKGENAYMAPPAVSLMRMSEYPRMNQ